LPTMHSLLVSTVNVLTAAADAGNCRLVLAASLTEPEAGDSNATPASPYAAAKWASAGYARMFHRLYDLPVVMVRPFITKGPAQDSRKIITHNVLSLLRDEVPKLSSGNQEFDWIYIDDVIDGFVAAADAPHLDGYSVDLGSGVSVRVREVVNQLTAMLNTRTKPLFGALPDRPLERVRVADTADAFARLGWRPKTSLETGLARTIEWCREQAIALRAHNDSKAAIRQESR
jgi:UDP-glucose 4-epimerase